MLILSRKPNEQIVIGENIVITVVSISGGHVRLGVEAPREVSVLRQEVHQAGKQPPAQPPLQPPLPPLATDHREPDLGSTTP